MKPIAFLRSLRPLLFALLVGIRADAVEPHPSIPAIGSLDGLGINIHFTDPKPGEMEMIAAAGFRWVRMDLLWEATEREKDRYDFSAYDRLTAALARHKMRALFILDYGNKLYDSGVSPHSDEARNAFARWAAAAVTHFAGRGYLWEMWNEPNIDFWKPKTNVNDYIALATATARALRESGLTQTPEHPGEAFIGPGASGMDLTFLEACFKAGLLEDWCAVSVHPYRQSAPETVEEDYRKVRLLIRQYAPRARAIPIICSEWGYSTAWKHLDEEKQASYLVRQYLTNVANDIPLSIWYDWHDDGVNPTDPEHHFGIVQNEYHAGRDPVFDPKPAYRAAKAMTEQLAGMRFNKRLQFGFPDYYPLLFTKGSELRVVFWGRTRAPYEDWIPASPGFFRAHDYLGRDLPELEVRDKETPNFNIGAAPKYFEPRKLNDILRLAAAWDRLPLELVLEPDKPTEYSYAIVNPLEHAIKINAPASNALLLAPGERRTITGRYEPSRRELTRSFLSFSVPGVCQLDQMTVLIASKPLRVMPLPVAGESLPVRLGNPSGSAFTGRVEIDCHESGDYVEFAPIVKTATGTKFSFAVGQKEQIVTIPLGETPLSVYYGDIRVYERNESRLTGMSAMNESDHAQRIIASESIYARRIDDFGKYSPAQLAKAFTVSADGDAAVSSKLDLSIAAAPEGLPESKTSAIRLNYAFGAGWRFLRLSPSMEPLKAIFDAPKSLGWWVFGDGKGCIARIRFTDTRGQTFQGSGPKVDWNGWRYVTIPILSADAPSAGSLLVPADSDAHWGGPNDGLIDPPMKWDTIFLLDNTSREPIEGEIYLSTPTLIY